MLAPKSKLQGKACLSPNKRDQALASWVLSARVNAAPLPSKQSRGTLETGPKPKADRDKAAAHRVPQRHCRSRTTLLCCGAGSSASSETALQTQGTGSKRVHRELQRTS